VEGIASALGDGARWQIVELLAERPRSVGELAELTGLRQPQTTKHLQTLARAGLVAVYPLGQRRVYALESAPLAMFADRVRELAVTADAHQDERDVLARYRAAIEAESVLADRERWADGPAFVFERSGATWAQTHYLKPSNTTYSNGYQHFFGRAVACSSTAVRSPDTRNRARSRPKSCPPSGA